jgi:hypothetical protein
MTCARMRVTMPCSKKFINQMQRIPATKKISSQPCIAGHLKQRPSIRVRPTSSSHVNLRSRSDHPPSSVVQYARSGNVPQAMQLLHRTRSAIENRRARHRLIASGCRQATPALIQEEVSGGDLFVILSMRSGSLNSDRTVFTNST